MEPRPPSGAQIEIAHGSQSAILVEVGGAVREYRAGGRAILDGYGVDEMAGGARGQSLIPWPNRLADGRWTYAGQSLQLALTEPDKHNAIHGLVRWANWTVAARERSRVVMRHTLHAQKGWPFVLALELAYALDDDGLTVTTTATNLGARPCPYAAGAHPYLTLGASNIDEALLRIPAATYLPTDERQIPTGRRPVADTELDFRTPRPIGRTHIDYAFTDLVRDADGRARVILGDATRSVALWLDEHYPFVEIFTGDTLPEPHKRRTGLGVEPMTAPPNALQTGESLITLAPGRPFTTRWGIEPRL